MTGNRNSLIKALKAALTERLHMDFKAHPITCKMEDGAILIEGVVDKVRQKKKALLIAMEIAGQEGVVIDRLRVKPSVHMGDKEIQNHLSVAFAGEPALASLDIKVEVRDGVIDLEGKVGSLSHKRISGVLAWWVPGSVDVINSLEVDPPEEDSDDEIIDALRQVLEKDRLVNSAEITISTKDWTVTLNGLAGSEAERDAAEDDAWSIWGVNDVVNKIIIRPRAVQETI